MNKIKQLFTNSYIGEQLFFIGYILYLIRFVWVSTMFPLPSIINIGLILLFIILVGIKILFFDKYSLPTLLGIAAICICSVLTVLSSNSIGALFWAFLLIGAKDISFRKFAKVYLIVTGTFVFLAFVASMIGVITNLQYSSTTGVRNSFGIIYPTDFSAYVFFLLLVYFYLKGENIRGHHLCVASIIAVFVYYFCKAKVDSICILLLVLIYGFERLINRNYFHLKKWKTLWNCVWNRCGIYIMPICALFSILTTLVYSPNNALLSFLDGIFTNRLSLGKRGFNEYGISLFGKDIEMIGFGGTTKAPDNYFFLDCSYVNILLSYGILFFCIVIVVYAISIQKNKTDRYILFSVALLSINCIIAHHLLSVAYNPFSFLLLMNNRKSLKDFSG